MAPAEKNRYHWLIAFLLGIWVAGCQVSDGYVLENRSTGLDVLDHRERTAPSGVNVEAYDVLHNGMARQHQVQTVDLGDPVSQAARSGLHKMDHSRHTTPAGPREIKLSLTNESIQQTGESLREYNSVMTSSIAEQGDRCKTMLCTLLLGHPKNKTDPARQEQTASSNLILTTSLPTTMSNLGPHARSSNEDILFVEAAQIGHKPMTPLRQAGGRFGLINHNPQSLVQKLLKQIGSFLPRKTPGSVQARENNSQLPAATAPIKQSRTKRQTSGSRSYNETKDDNLIGGDLDHPATDKQATTEALFDGGAAEHNQTVDVGNKRSNISEGGLSYRSMIGLVDSPSVVDNPWGRNGRNRGSSDADIPHEVNKPENAASIEQLQDAYVNSSTEASAVHNSAGNNVMTRQTELFASTEIPEAPEVEPTAGETELLMAGLEAEPSASAPAPESELKPVWFPSTEPEPEFEPGAEAEQSPEGEPEGDMGNTVSGDCSPCFAEPEPDWETAKLHWQEAWEIHLYGVGILFAILAAYSLLSILRLWRKKNLLSQGYFISLNTIMFTMGLCRAVYFLADGYNANGLFHPALAYFLYSIGFPCLTSAFSILFLALLQSLQMQLLSPRIQTTPVLISIITFHFFFSILADVIVGYVADSKVLLLICQGIFVVWGLFLFCGYAYIFKRLRKSAIRRQKSMLKLMVTKTDSDLNTSGLKGKIQMKFPLNVAIVVTMVTALLGFVCAGLQIYAMVGVYSVLSSDTPEPWPWWSFMLALRMTELCMCATMSFVATQPFRYRSQYGTSVSDKGCGLLVSTLPCCRLCDNNQIEDDKVEWGNFDQVFKELGGHGSGSGHERTIAVRYSENTEETSVLHHCPGRRGDISYTPDQSRGASKLVPKTKSKVRPKSMLVYENGFVRFRQEGDPEGEPVASTDDELDPCDLNSKAAYKETNGALHWTDNGHCGVTKPMLQRKTSRKHSSGTGTPATPRSFCSADMDAMSGVFSFKAPSSIHLRESIERALDGSCPRFNMRTPDILNYPDSDRYYSVPNTPDSILDTGYSFESLGGSSNRSRFSFKVKGAYRSSQSAHDLKTKAQWTHKSPKHYWDRVKTKSSNVSLNQTGSTRYAHLDDTDGMLLNRKRNRNLSLSRYRSRSDSLAEIPFYTDDI